MSKYTTSKAESITQKLKAQLAEKERLIAAIEAEEAAHDALMMSVLQKAGRARVALVEDLLERFGVEPAPLTAQLHKRTGEPIIDRKTGQEKMVDPDPDETDRMRRLAQAIDEALAPGTNASSPSEPAPQSWSMRDEPEIDDSFGGLRSA